MSAVQQAIASYGAAAGGPTYATWDPSNKGAGVTLTLSNLRATNTSGVNELVKSTLGKSTGKWYWEITVQTVREDLGVANSTQSTSGFVGDSPNSTGYNSSGVIFRNSASLSAAASYTTGDVIGFALDMGAGTLQFFKNNVSQYVATGITGTVYAAGGGTSGSSSQMTANFGSTALTYSPPSGYNAGLYT